MMNRYDDEELLYTPEESNSVVEEGSTLAQDEIDIPAVAHGSEVPALADASSFEASDFIDRVNEHSEILAAHGEDISWLLEQFKPANKNKPVDWSWYHITGVQRRKLWEDLVDFVAWVNGRYFIHHKGKQIVPCWYQHPVVVEELTGLWAAWWDATHNAKKPNTKMAEFHRRYFWPTMEQIWKELKSCDGSKGHMVYGGTVREGDPDMMDFIGREVEEYQGPLGQS